MSGAPARGRSAGRDRRLMEHALGLAGRGAGRVAPNPLVGAVVARDGEVVGEGWHAEFGGDHAEVAALREAGEAARGAAVYVTLEPCAHEGKTPPCADALIEAGVARVIVACRDPDPRARGGVERLEAAGVEVEVGTAARRAARQNAAFLWERARERPFVTLKLALSLDGRIAAAEGERTAVTGEEALAHAHRLRATHDAVLVGRRTVEVDDPRLTARGEVVPRRPSRRVVLDSELRIPSDAALVRGAEEAPVVVLCAPGADPGRREALEGRGVRVLTARRAGDAEGLDPEAVLGTLAREGIGTVLVEGGGRVAASFLRRRCVERAHLLYAPVLFGPEGVEGFPGLDALPGGWSAHERSGLGRDTLLVLESEALGDVLDEATRAPERGAVAPGGG